MSSAIVFVCGATGTQGGALTHHLLKNGIKVQAITRDIDSIAAKRLLSLGVALTEGNFDNEECLVQSMTGCTTLFLNLTPNHTDPTGEVEQAKQILAAAKQVGINQIIYTSALGTANPERLRHWNPNSLVGMVVLSKQAIEEQVRTSGLEQWTILRPGNFMSNFLDPLVRMYQGLVETGTFTTALTKDTVLPMVDPNDIGKFAAAAVMEPARFNHKEIEIASQMMGLEEVMQDLSRATTQTLRVSFLSEEKVDRQVRQNPFLAAQVVMRDMSQFVDMDEVRAWNIELGSFAQFLEREKERVSQTYSGTCI